MLSDEESAKLALSEAAKKVSDLKARQWEISKNAVIILAFLAAVFYGDVRYSLQAPTWVKYAVLVFYFSYFCSIYWQAFSNTNRYKEIYRKAGQRLYSLSAQDEYFQDNPANMIEDEGRLQFFLFLVVAAFFVLVLAQIYAASHRQTAPSGPATSSGIHLTLGVGFE